MQVDGSWKRVNSGSGCEWTALWERVGSGSCCEWMALQERVGSGSCCEWTALQERVDSSSEVVALWERGVTAISSLEERPDHALG